MSRLYTPKRFGRNFLACRLSIVVFCLSAAYCASQSQAQDAAEQIGDAKLVDLSGDAYSALEQVTESSVTATIRFLASDELGGRKTATHDFDVAAAYVASRLQAAGAIGLGQDGSYYVITNAPATRTPANGSLVQGYAELQAEVLTAGENDIQAIGNVRPLERASKTQGVLFAPLPSEGASSEKFALSELAKLVKQAAEKEAVALLVLVDADCPLWNKAKRNQETRQARSRPASLPAVMLVGAKSLSETESYSLTIPGRIKEDYPMRNVAAYIPGRDPESAKKAVLFSAHLDHLGSNPGLEGKDKIFNGADDDASGVTAVVTLADVFGKMKNKPLHSTIFMTFWGEEMGLLGSKAFGEDPAWPLEDILANVNIEMIGRPAENADNKMWMTGWNKSNLGILFAQGARRVGVEVFEHPQFSEMLYTRSDNYAFAKNGVIAHSFSAGSLHKDYHQVTDEWTKLEMPHMTQIIRGIFAGSLPIAEGKLQPQAK